MHHVWYYVKSRISPNNLVTFTETCFDRSLNGRSNGAETWWDNDNDNKWGDLHERFKTAYIKRETLMKKMYDVLTSYPDYTLWVGALLWSITLLHARKNVIYLFCTIKNQMVYWRIWGSWKKKIKSADVDWRGHFRLYIYRVAQKKVLLFDSV